MSAKGWKTKLTTKQLENKRLGDRQRQQKLRQDRENSAMRMERQLKLALSQNESDEVKAINEENAALRAQVVQLKAALRKISSLATGLQQGLESVTPTLEMIPVHPLGDVYAEERPLGVLQRERSALRRCSIVRRVAQAAVANGRLEDLLSYGDGFIDCALSWKLLQGHRLGLMFLVDSPDCTSSRDIHFIHDQNFHTQLIRRITHLEPIVMPQATSNPLQESSKKTLSIFDIQDRQIAFHTLKVLEPYLPRLRSSVDRILHFWILYSFSRFWAFPTQRNFLQIPPWMFPVPGQLFNDHPGYLDLLPWPSLRTYLSHSWYNYDIGELYTILSESSYFSVDSTLTESCSLFFDETRQTLALSPMPEPPKWHLSNFKFHGRFLTKYPELVMLVQSDCTVSTDLLNL